MRRLLCSVLLCLAVLSPTPGRAARVAPGSDPGAEYALPLDASDSGTLVRYARAMGSVHQVMRVFAQRGYIARPEGDRGVNAIPGKISVVFLVYEKPGYVPPPDGLGAPVIMVISTLTWQGVRTDVAGGFMTLDGATGLVTVSDPSINLAEGTTAADGVVVPGTDGDSRFCCDENQKSALGQYVACAGLGNMTCVLGGLGAALWQPAPVAIGVTLTCIAVNTGNCLREAISHWPR